MIQATESLMSTKELVVQMNDHCIFRSSSTFLGGNNSLYFAKIAMALAFSNSPDFHFSKYVKMSKWSKIA